MSKINLSPDQVGDFCVCMILDKLLHPDEVIPFNKEFNEYAEKLRLKGMKPVSLSYYLAMSPTMRIYYKRIKKVFEYDQNQSAVIQIWPYKVDKEQLEKENQKDSIVKRIIKKLLMKEDINTEERKIIEEEVLNEVL